MAETKTKATEPTVEELKKQLAETQKNYMQLAQRAQGMANTLQQIDRLSVLLKVMETAKYYSEDFIAKVAEEIQNVIYPPVAENKEEK